MTDLGTGHQMVVLSAPSYRSALVSSVLVPALAGEGVVATVVDMSALVGRIHSGPLAAVLAAALADSWPVPGPAAVLGDDIAAPVATELARQHPELVDHLILGSPRPATPTAAARQAAEELAHRDSGSSAAATALLRAAQLFSPERMADDAAIASLLDELTDLVDETDKERELVAALSGISVDSDTVAALEVPCLLMAHTFDPFVPARGVAALAAASDHAQMACFDAGHGGGIDLPAPVAARLAAFLRSSP